MACLTAFVGFINNDRPTEPSEAYPGRKSRTGFNPGDQRFGNSDTTNWPKSFGIGRAVSEAEISAINISIKPNGAGLPAGSGSAVSGQTIYEIKCMACHGKNGAGGISSALVGAMGDTVKAKTIGNYWPYATTLFDYIRRAMPFNQPGSLTSNEVYGLTAYLLFKNKIIEQGVAINAASLPKIKRPAQSLIVEDDRHGGPEVK